MYQTLFGKHDIVTSCKQPLNVIETNNECDYKHVIKTSSVMLEGACASAEIAYTHGILNSWIVFFLFIHNNAVVYLQPHTQYESREEKKCEII